MGVRHREGRGSSWGEGGEGGEGMNFLTLHTKTAFSMVQMSV